MVSAFDSDLQALRARLLEMGGLAERQLARAIDAVRRRDLPLASQVVADDAELDSREVALEEMALRTLALRTPLAQDLRETIAALKIASTVERIGDLAKNVARRVRSLNEHAPPRVKSGILRMGQLAQTQFAEVLDAYAERDTVAAIAVWRRDVDIDELYNSVFRDLVAQMTHEPSLVSQGAQLMFVAKNLERIGDHTTFIAEMTYYVVIGQPLGDERPKGDPLFAIPDPEGRLSDGDL